MECSCLPEDGQCLLTMLEPRAPRRIPEMRGRHSSNPREGIGPRGGGLANGLGGHAVNPLPS